MGREGLKGQPLPTRNSMFSKAFLSTTPQIDRIEKMAGF